MRIAFLTHYTSLYGANLSLLNLILGLRNYGVKAYVICPSDGPFIQELIVHEIPIKIIPIRIWNHVKQDPNQKISQPISLLKQKFKVCKRAIQNIRCVPEIVQYLEKFDIDLIYTNSASLPVGALIASCTGKPHIWHLREFCDLDYALSFDFGNFASRFLINHSGTVITVSYAVKKHFLICDNKDNNFHVVYNGVAHRPRPRELCEVSKNTKIRKGTFTFSIVGLLHPCKGQQDAIRALSIVADHFPNVYLLIAGDGEDEYLRKLSREVGVHEKVKFLGYVKDPYTVYSQSNAVLICSKNEAMGRVTVEAMLAARLVIGYDNAGTSEIIKHESTGLLYRGDHRNLAKCMMDFMSSPERFKEIETNAFTEALTKYSIETYTENILQIIEHTIRTKKTKNLLFKIMFSMQN